MIDTKKEITVASIGSHSMLEIAKGAKELGFRTLAVCEKGREQTYAVHYKTKGDRGVIDDVLVLSKFKDILKKENQKILAEKNSVFVPHRSFQVYLGFDYDSIERNFDVPVFGNRFLLRIEERGEERNQYHLLEEAGIRTPKRFSGPEEIDRMCIVKILQEGGFERRFFLCSGKNDFEEKAKNLVNEGQVSKEAIRNAVIEEYILGAQVNFNFFYSKLGEELELIGTDARRQTSLDGLLRLPAEQQLDFLKKNTPSFEEAGHFAVTVVESMLEKAFDIGEKIVKTAKKEFSPGIIGPFALQAAITPGNPKKEIVVFDASFRMPGSPGIAATPYSSYLYNENISMGKRIAMEIRLAVQEARLEEIIT